MWSILRSFFEVHLQIVFHLVAHPDHVKHVLLDNAKNYPRSWYYGRLKVVVGDGLVTTEGAPWRRLLSPHR